jgi:predicted aspartyl protease
MMIKKGKISGVAWIGCWLLLQVSVASAVDVSTISPPVPAAAEPTPEVKVEAPEPRYVAPTRRDRIGRIWAPVFINDKGPFRLVLDTGASRSGVTSDVAAALGIAPDQSEQVTLQGVTGSATVPTIPVESVLVGDLLVHASKLPIITDALGGAQGVLGTEGLTDRRIYIDFQHDLIRINRSHNEHAPPGFKTIELRRSGEHLLVVDALVGGVHCEAIIDTGGQVSIGNRALRNALKSMRSRRAEMPEEIEGATGDVQSAQGYPAPPINLGGIQIIGAHVSFGDMRIFEHWHLTRDPVILIGMDCLGLLDVLIIDYKRQELQLELRERSS